MKNNVTLMRTLKLPWKIKLMVKKTASNKTNIPDTMLVLPKVSFRKTKVVFNKIWFKL